MSWIYDYEVAIPSFEARNGKLYFSLQISRRPGAEWRGDENELISAFRSYSQFRKLWRQLSKMTKVNAEKMKKKSSLTPLTSFNASTNAILSRLSRLSTGSMHSTPTPSPRNRTPSMDEFLQSHTSSTNNMMVNSMQRSRRRMDRVLGSTTRHGTRTVTTATVRASSPCTCNAQACPFQSLYGILKDYRFPSKHRFKRKNKQLLDARRLALETFILHIREYLIGFPRSLLHSIDVNEKCGVLGLFADFIGYSSDLRSLTISRSPLACSGWRADVFSSSSPLTTPTAAGTRRSTVVGREQHIETSYESTEVVDEFEERLSDHVDVTSAAPIGYGEEEEEVAHEQFQALSDEEDIPILAEDSSDEEQEQEANHTSFMDIVDDFTTRPSSAVVMSTTSEVDNNQEIDEYMDLMQVEENHNSIGPISNQMEQVAILEEQTSKTLEPNTTTTILPKLQIKSATVRGARCLLTEFRNHLLQQYGDDIAELKDTAPSDARLWEIGLYVACCVGHEYGVGSFLFRGTSANATLEDGTSCLHAACRGGHVDIVQILIQHDADVNLRNSSGLSPLIMAISNRHTRIVEVLLEVGANANLGTLKDVTPLHIAVAVRCVDMVQCLINYQAHVQVANVNGTTPLHVAAEVGSYQICEVLLKNGANVSYENASGQDACMISTAKGHTVITQLCIKYQRGSRSSISSSYHKSRTSSLIKQRRSSQKSNQSHRLSRSSDRRSSSGQGSYLKVQEELENRLTGSESRPKSTGSVTL